MAYKTHGCGRGWGLQAVSGSNSLDSQEIWNANEAQMWRMKKDFFSAAYIRAFLCSGGKTVHSFLLHAHRPAYRLEFMLLPPRRELPAVIPFVKHQTMQMMTNSRLNASKCGIGQRAGKIDVRHCSNVCNAVGVCLPKAFK